MSTVSALSLRSDAVWTRRGRWGRIALKFTIEEGKMRLGFTTTFSEERVRFARQAGFDCLELSARVGSELDPSRLDREGIGRVKEVLAENGVAVSSLFSNVNLLHPDPRERERNIEHFVRAMDLCRELGTDILACNAWGDRAKDVEGNLPAFQEVFGHCAQVAEEKGIRIAIENCPHMSRTWPLTIGSIALSPAAWEKLFAAVPSPALGLEYDPSHLVWLGTDYIRALYDFGERVFIVHAKDTEVLEDVLAVEGIYGERWWRYRIPGWGEVDWVALFTALREIGFAGDMVIEHEDPLFSGERFNEGLMLGKKFLEQFYVRA